MTVTALRTDPDPQPHATPEAGAALALAPMVEVWFQMLVDHVPDAKHNCVACTHGGTGARSTPWPCSLRGVAEVARRTHAAMSVTVPSPRRPMDDDPDAPPRPSPRRRRLRGVHGIARVLTPREQEYLQLAADGCCDRVIGDRLALPERTIATSIGRLIRTLGVADRVMLLVLALREGVIA